MGNTANKAQGFLLDNNCGDLILNDSRTTKREDRIYASDIMMMFLESERGKNADTGERQSNIPDVINSGFDAKELKKTAIQQGIDCINNEFL